jgi:hypothetical protein
MQINVHLTLRHDMQPALLSNMSQLNLSGFQLALALARSRLVASHLVCLGPRASSHHPDLPIGIYYIPSMTVHQQSIMLLVPQSINTK